jgi:hypothetical protein
MHKCTSEQERRASARRGSTNTFTQTPARLLARPSRVCAPITLAIVCSDTTEAYAPRSCAAMRTSFGEKRFLRCTNEHPTKSGGRQPAVGCIAPRGQCTASNVRRVTTVQSRAAGVSPPWFDKHVYADTSAIARKTVDSMWAERRCICVQRYHGGLTPPALVLQCERLPAKNDFCDAHTHIRLRAAGVSPPWVALRRANSARRITSGRVTTVQSRAANVSPPWISNSGAIVNVYHGGLTPTAPGCATCVRRAKAPFAMHKRTFSRAASVRSSCAVLRAVTRATDGVPDRKAVIERASRPGWSSEVNTHSGWQNRWPKDFSSSVVQRSEHAQRMAEPLAKGFLVQRVYEVNMHSGWQNRWPKDFSSSVVQRSEHAQRIVKTLPKGPRCVSKPGGNWGSLHRQRGYWWRLRAFVFSTCTAG